jgi:hypothetical protein
MTPELKSLFHGLAAGCSFIGLTLGLVKVDLISTLTLLLVSGVFLMVPTFYKKGNK